MKSKENDLWIASFGDVTKYIRERMNASIKIETKEGKIIVTLTHSLDKSIYDFPLTLKTYVPSKWKEVQVKQDTEIKNYSTRNDTGGTYVLYQANPAGQPIELSEI